MAALYSEKGLLCQFIQKGSELSESPAPAPFAGKHPHALSKAFGRLRFSFGVIFLMIVRFFQYRAAMSGKPLGCFSARRFHKGPMPEAVIAMQTFGDFSDSTLIDPGLLFRNGTFLLPGRALTSCLQFFR